MPNGHLMDSYSKVVSEGMKRVSNDLHALLKCRGFKRASSRTWHCESGGFIKTVHLQRSGSSYGAPRNASVGLRLTLSLRAKANVTSDPGDLIISDSARRANGYAYHHRFNAATGSTYDRCVQELELYVAEVAEPWFQERLRSSNPLEADAR